MTCYWHVMVDIVYYSKKHRCSFREYALSYKLPMTEIPIMDTKVNLPLSVNLQISTAMQMGKWAGGEIYEVSCEPLIVYDEDQVETLADELIRYGFKEYQQLSVERRPDL